MENLITPVDRVHRVVVGIPVEHMEHVPRRIVGRITRIGRQLHLRKLRA
jgi:hypothetical protein